MLLAAIFVAESLIMAYVNPLYQDWSYWGNILIDPLLLLILILPFVYMLVRAEQTLQLHAQIISQTHDSVITTNFDGTVTSWNKGAEKLYGYMTAEAIGRHISLIYPKDRLGSLNKNIIGTLMEKGSHEVEDKCINKSGETIYTHLSLSLIKNNKGQPKGMIGYSVDITERKQAEEALLKSEELYRAVVENQTESIVRWREDNTISFANDIFLTFFDKKKEDVVGKSFLPFFSGDSKENIEKRKLRLTPDNPHSTEIHQVLMKDGSIRWQEWTDRLIPARGVDGLEFQSVGRDITDRVLAEESLRQSEEKFSTIFHSSPDALAFTTAEDGTIIDVNEGFERQSGYSRDEVIGKTVNEINVWVVPEERNRYIDLLLKQGRVSEYETEMLNKAGDVLPVTLSAELIDLDGIPHIVTIIRDISERKKAEMSTRLASIGELAAGVAHEINTPIASIMLNAQMLGEYEDMPVNEKQKLYQAISSNSERVADIVKKLLSFARANEKKKSLEYIGFIVEEALSLVKYQINKSGAILDVDIPDSLPKVLINKQQLQQVFLNIINNSRYSLNQKQYVHGEKMRLEIKGDLAERSNTQYVRLTFHDNGEGIAANVLDKIMLPFYTTKPEGSGTGLGLSISHGIMKDHDGLLEIESKEGVYTKAIVYIPVEVSTE
jgi:PAS domain S-box-containing protein